MIIQIKPIIQKHIKDLCLLRYKGHPKGCPNYNKKEGCPADGVVRHDTPSLDNFFDMEKPIYAIINQYDLKSHKEKMKAAHPNWTERQLKCVLYWQPTARKMLQQKIDQFLKENPEYTVTKCPEGMGVNVTRTLKEAGFKLEWPASNVACQVAFAGIKKND